MFKRVRKNIESTDYHFKKENAVLPDKRVSVISNIKSKFVALNDKTQTNILNYDKNDTQRLSNEEITNGLDKNNTEFEIIQSIVLINTNEII